MKIAMVRGELQLNVAPWCTLPLVLMLVVTPACFRPQPMTPGRAFDLYRSIQASPPPGGLTRIARE